MTALRGINLAGLEGGYGDTAGSWPRATGPVAGHDYPLFAPQLLDYYHSKGIRVLRLLFSWDRMQSELWNDVPDPVAGYARYFTNLKQIVDYATGRGITVIIEPWQANSSNGVGGATWLGNLVGDTAVGEVDRFAFAGFWGKLAANFRDNPLVEFGLVNEPHDMSTMSWWTTAQKCVDAIRLAGATTTIYVPGNGYTAASRWTDETVDTATPQRSNAYGWLHVNNGAPLFDPQHNCIAEVHLYLDDDGSGTGQEVASRTVARERLAIAVDEARAQQRYRVFVGEIGAVATSVNAHEAWQDFVAYLDEPDVADLCAGFAWFAGGWPEWWSDTAAPHFSVSPTHPATFTGDTANMALIDNDFTP